MKYVKMDGSVVNAPKDCECVCHEGPCWLHCDYLLNRMHTENILGIRILEGNPNEIFVWIPTEGKIYGFIREELCRIKNKKDTMRVLQIQGVIYETEEEKKEEGRFELHDLDSLLKKLEEAEKKYVEKDGKYYRRKE